MTPIKHTPDPVGAETNAEKKLEAIIRDLTPSSAPLMQQLTLWSHVRGLVGEIKAEAIAQHEAATKGEKP